LKTFLYFNNQISKINDHEKRFFLLTIIGLLFGFSACEEKVESDPFRGVLMGFIKPQSSIPPFSVVESIDSNQQENNFLVNFHDQIIFSGVFDPSLDRPYDVRLALLKTNQSGQKIWAMYIVSWWLYHSEFFLIQEDGQLVQEHISNFNSQGTAYFMMDLFFDGENTISLRNAVSGSRKEIKIPF